MPAILEIPEVRQRVSALSVEEYHRLGEFNQRGLRTELIRGIVIETGPKSPLHSFIAKRLYDRITAALPKGWMVCREDPITLSDSEPEPDIAVVRGTEADFSRRTRRPQPWWWKWPFPAQASIAKTPHAALRPG